MSGRDKKTMEDWFGNTGADLAAELSESQFDAAGYSIGEPVLVTWESAHASRLKPVNFATTNSATVNSATVAPAETAA